MGGSSFEGADSSPGLGSTTVYTGTVGTSSANIPSSAGNIIFDVLVRCPAQTNTNILYVCLDGGDTNFQALRPGEWVAGALHVGLKQIQVKGSVASVSYEVVLNRI